MVSADTDSPNKHKVGSSEKIASGTTPPGKVAWLRGRVGTATLACCIGLHVALLLLSQLRLFIVLGLLIPTPLWLPDASYLVSPCTTSHIVSFLPIVKLPKQPRTQSLLPPYDFDKKILASLPKAILDTKCFPMKQIWWWIQLLWDHPFSRDQAPRGGFDGIPLTIHRIRMGKACSVAQFLRPNKSLTSIGPPGILQPDGFL